MAICIRCGKRANARHSCLWCGRGPVCLKCTCDCRRWKDPETVAQRIGHILNHDDDRPTHQMTDVAALEDFKDWIRAYLVTLNGRVQRADVAGLDALNGYTSGQVDAYDTVIGELAAKLADVSQEAG